MRKETTRLVVRALAGIYRNLLKSCGLQRLWSLFQSEIQLSMVAQVGEGCFIGRGAQVIGGDFISLGTDVGIGPFSRVEALAVSSSRNFPHLIIEDGVSTGWFAHIACAQQVRIGKDTLIASSVYISDHNHGFSHGNTFGKPPADTELESSPVSIGERCWIGEQVCILPGVTIGDDCLIGAGSIVTRDIPAGHLAVGVPARIIKKRYSETGEWVNVSRTRGEAIG